MLTTSAHETTELLQLDVCLLSGERHPGPLLDHVASTLVAGVRISTATSLGLCRGRRHLARWPGRERSSGKPGGLSSRGTRRARHRPRPNVARREPRKRPPDARPISTRQRGVEAPARAPGPAAWCGTADFIEASWFDRIQDHFREGLPERDHLQDPYLTHDVDGSPAKVVRMPALSLEDLLRRHNAPTRIDFMSIDAEFSEWFILKAFPFDRFEVLALCVHSKFRHAGILVDGKHAEDIRRVLCDLGYFYDREHSRHLEHDFFVHPNVIEHPLPDPAVRGGP